MHSEREMINLAQQWHDDYGNISPALLQRKLKISYTKAVEIITLVIKELIKE